MRIHRLQPVKLRVACCKSLKPGAAPNRLSLPAAGSGWETQTRALQRPVDLLVGTPQRVLQHAAKGNLAFGDVQWLVLDEADTMFDSGASCFSQTCSVIDTGMSFTDRTVRVIAFSWNCCRCIMVHPEGYMARAQRQEQRLKRTTRANDVLATSCRVWQGRAGAAEAAEGQAAACVLHPRRRHHEPGQHMAL